MKTNERPTVDIEGWVRLSTEKFPNELGIQAACIEHFVSKITRFNSEDVKRCTFNHGAFKCNGTIFYSGGNVYLWWKLKEASGSGEAIGLEAMNATDRSLRLLFCTDPTQKEPFMFPLIYQYNL